jgi:hypothetical protein
VRAQVVGRDVFGYSAAFTRSHAVDIAVAVWAKG